MAMSHHHFTPSEFPVVKLQGVLATRAVVGKSCKYCSEYLATVDPVVSAIKGENKRYRLTNAGAYLSCASARIHASLSSFLNLANRSPLSWNVAMKKSTVICRQVCGAPTSRQMSTKRSSVICVDSDGLKRSTKA